MSDSFAVVRNILMHIAAGVLVHETPPAAEALLVDDLAETLADLLRQEEAAALQRPSADVSLRRQ
ncbi:MAG: hypothetical protein DMF77_04075 [Acidobacteria bacterium]|nr:MAG: hypothetical protein DMF77_04075 [Acidobacteriota bacterium]